MPVQKNCEAHSFKFSSLTSSSLSIYITQIQHFEVQQTYVTEVQANCILYVLLVFPRVVSELTASKARNSLTPSLNLCFILYTVCLFLSR